MRYHLNSRGQIVECHATVNRCPLEHYEGNPADYKPDGLDSFSVLRKNVFQGQIEGLNNNSYYGVKVDSGVVERHRDFLRNFLGDEKFSRVTGNLASRPSGDEYHVTVLTPKETRLLRKRNPGFASTLPVEPAIRVLGVGQASNDSSTAWFIVCESEQVNVWRQQNGLERKDLHVTLGFDPKDVYDRPKNCDTLIK